jgi:hypothetical protein
MERNCRLVLHLCSIIKLIDRAGEVHEVSSRRGSGAPIAMRVGAPRFRTVDPWESRMGVNVGAASAPNMSSNFGRRRGLGRTSSDDPILGGLRFVGAKFATTYFQTRLASSSKDQSLPRGRRCR